MYDSDELRALAVAAQSGDDSPRLDLRQEMTPETVLALLDEIEALRKDAERYRFLKFAYPFGDWHVRGRWGSGGLIFIGVVKPAQLDAAIDAARTQGGVYSPAWISRAIPFASRPTSTSSFL